MLLYEPNFPILPNGRILVESNMPAALDNIGIGDEYLQRAFAKPDNWRWRIPDLDAIKLENQQLNKDMTFHCDPSMPTLDSFAAFSDDGEADIPATPDNSVQTQSDYWQIADLITPDPVRAPSTNRAQPVTTQNVFMDALTGIIKGVTPASTAALSNRINPGSRPAAGRASSVAAGNKNNTALVIGVAAVIGLMFLANK